MRTENEEGIALQTQEVQEANAPPKCVQLVFSGKNESAGVRCKRRIPGPRRRARSRRRSTMSAVTVRLQSVPKSLMSPGFKRWQRNLPNDGKNSIQQDVQIIKRQPNWVLTATVQRRQHTGRRLSKSRKEAARREIQLRAGTKSAGQYTPNGKAHHVVSTAAIDGLVGFNSNNNGPTIANSKACELPTTPMRRSSEHASAAPDQSRFQELVEKHRHEIYRNSLSDVDQPGSVEGHLLYLKICQNQQSQLQRSVRPVNLHQEALTPVLRMFHQDPSHLLPPSTVRPVG